MRKKALRLTLQRSPSEVAKAEEQPDLFFRTLARSSELNACGNKPDTEYIAVKTCTCIYYCIKIVWKLAAGVPNQMHDKNLMVRRYQGWERWDDPLQPHTYGRRKSKKSYRMYEKEKLT